MCCHPLSKGTGVPKPRGSDNPPGTALVKTIKTHAITNAGIPGPSTTLFSRCHGNIISMLRITNTVAFERTIYQVLITYLLLINYLLSMNQ